MNIISSDTTLRAAEWVLPGHPDKLADAVADALVQAAQQRQAEALCAIEVAVHRDQVYLTGRLACEGADQLPLRDLVREVYRSAGYGAGQGAAPAGTDAAAAQPGGGGFMIMMMVLLGTMILFTFVSGRREKKKRAELLGSIKKHDKVMTIGGVMGTVVELKDDSVVLKVDETSNTRITFSKTAISQVIAQDSAA